MVLSFIIRWYKNRTTKCLKGLQKRRIDANLRQLVLIRQDHVLVNLSTCFFTIDSEFFFYFSKKWIGRAMGNKTFYGDGLTVLGGRLHISTNFSRGTPSPGTVQLIIIGVLPVVSSSSKKTMKCLPMRRYPATRKCHDPQNFNKVV